MLSLARKRVQPKNRMRENRTSGSVRGVPGNGHSYRERLPILPCDCGDEQFLFCWRIHDDLRGGEKAP